jgi:hypothetical protein
MNYDVTRNLAMSTFSPFIKKTYSLHCSQSKPASSGTHLMVQTWQMEYLCGKFLPAQPITFQFAEYGVMVSVYKLQSMSFNLQ